MNGFKKCSNGHYYQESLSECPYCKNGNGNLNDSTTVNIDLGESDPTATLPTILNPVSTGTKTQIMETPGTDTPTVPVSPHPGGKNTPNHTVFGDEIIETTQNGSQQVVIQKRSTRKLVGWLVSYSFDPMGVDFKLFEGRNIIGRDVDCNITVNDGLMSGKHAILLYRDNKYKISDNLSTHGTFVNDIDIEDEHCELHDGDSIKLGATIFKFRTSF